MSLNFEQMPAAVGQILERLTRLEVFIGEQLLTRQEPDNLSNGKRIVTAQQLAKYLKRPISAIYQMEFKGQIKAQRMPNSRKLYFDLDVIDALMSANETKSNNQ